MAGIELPDLIQRVRVDTSDLATAEKRLKASGRAADASTDSLDRLSASTTGAAESSHDLDAAQTDQARSSDRASASGRRLAETIGKVRDATASQHRAVAASVTSSEALRHSELRLAVAQRQVEVAQSRLNRLRAEGKDGTDAYARAELNVIDALRRVARVQDLAARAATRTQASTDRNNSSLAGFVKRAREAGDAGRFMALGFSAIKIPAIVTGITLAASAISSLGAGAIALTGQLAPAIEGVGTAAVAAAAQFGPLLGAVAALPAGILAIKGSTAVFKALTEGPAKASAAIRQYGADSEQARKALAGLSPEARTFATALADTQSRLETIRRAGQAAAFPGFTDALRTSRSLLPVVQQGFVGVAKSLGQVARQAATAFSSPAFRRDIGVIAARNARLVSTLGSAAISVVSALRGVVVAAGPMTAAFAKIGRNVAASTDAFVNSEAGQRRLATFFARTQQVVISVGRSLRDLASVVLTVGRAVSRGIGTDMVGGLEHASSSLRDFVNRADVLRRIELFSNRTFRSLLQFGRTVRDVTVALVNIGRIGARAIGIDFTGGLERASARFREFTESVTGQNTIAAYFAGARPVLVETGRLIRDVAKAFASFSQNTDLAPVISQIRTELLPAIIDLTRSVGARLGPTLVDLATAFIKLAQVMSFSPIIAVAGALAELAISIANLAQVVPGLSTVIASLIAFKIALGALATVGKFTGITGLATSITAAGTAGTAGAKGLTGFVQGLRLANTTSVETSSRMNRIGASFRGLKVDSDGAVTNIGKVRGAVGGLTSFLGGPWGIGLLAAGAALTIFARKHAQAKARVEELTNALIADNGVLGKNTRETTFNNLVKDGAVDAAKKFGISLRDLTDAALGNADAAARVQAAVQAATQGFDVQSGTWRDSKGVAHELTGEQAKLVDAMAKVTGAVGEQNAELIKSQGAFADRTAAGLNDAAATDVLTGAVVGYNTVAATASIQTEATRKAFIRAAVEAGATRKAAKKLADTLGLIKSPPTITIAITGVDPAIQRIADLRFALQGIPTSVTIGILNKVKGAGGALGEAPSTPTGPTMVSPRVAERAATQKAAAEKKPPPTPKVPDPAPFGDAGADAGSTFSNQFVKSANGELTKSGTKLVRNLVKGLTGSQAQIRQATKDLRTLIRGAFSGDQEDALVARVRKRNRQLLDLAKERDAIIERIKKAREDVIQGAAQAGDQLKSTITDLGNVTDVPQAERSILTAAETAVASSKGTSDTVATSITAIIGNLRRKVELAKRFSKDLHELKRRGVDAATLRQLIEAGPIEGGSAARALAAATDKQLAEVVSLQNTLTDAGAKAGTFAQTTLEKVGLDAIDGLLTGLRSKRSEVEEEMLRIARIMRDSIRKALGIHSPSTVFAGDVADPSVDGIISQFARRRRDVGNAAAALGRAMIPSVPLASDIGPLPQQGIVSAANGQRIGTVINIDRIEMTTHNPKQEPLAEVTAPDNLRKVAAVLSR